MTLEVKDLHTFYGLSHILFGINLSVKEGEMAFILGRNGVGKSTTLLSIIGLVKPRSGSIRFQGKEIAGKAPHLISKAGIGFVPEDRRILSGMTVEENLKVACRKKAGSNEWNIDRIYALFPRLQERRYQGATTLSGGEQQMLTIARTLMGNPHLLLIDEPIEGLAPLIVKLVCEQLNLLKEQGMTGLVTDDGISLALRLADRIYFLEKGQVKWEGTRQEILTDDQRVPKRYLGV